MRSNSIIICMLLTIPIVSFKCIDAPASARVLIETPNGDVCSGYVLNASTVSTTIGCIMFTKRVGVYPDKYKNTLAKTVLLRDTNGHKMLAAPINNITITEKMDVNDIVLLRGHFKNIDYFDQYIN